MTIFDTGEYLEIGSDVMATHVAGVVDALTDIQLLIRQLRE